MKQITEWWAAPLDRYGDPLEVYYCDSRTEAILTRGRFEADHVEAEEWRLEKVVRRYESDGNLVDEHVTEQQW